MDKPPFPAAFILPEVVSMEKHRCNVKFDNGKIVCASEILCSDCPERKKCQEIDIYIENKYAGIADCMTHDSHARDKGKIKQKRWHHD